jgi:hypothetical protein
MALLHAVQYPDIMLNYWIGCISKLGICGLFLFSFLLTCRPSGALCGDVCISECRPNGVYCIDCRGAI